MSESNICVITNPVKISSQGAFQRTASVDAFDRLRVSDLDTLFDSKQIYSNGGLQFVEETLSGSGSFDWVQARATTDITINAGAGRLLRQSKRYFNYQPGKSLFIIVTFCMNNSANKVDLENRVGYYDDDDGIYFSESDGALSIVKRSSVSGSPVNTSISQGSWNIDPFDGSGPSGVTLDVTKSQIFVADLEWLGVGAVRTGFVIDGILYYAHEFRHANIGNSVYMSTPNLPVRWEVIGGASNPGGTLQAICCSVASEAGDDNTGFNYSVDCGRSPVNTDDDLRSIVGIRLKATHNRATVRPSGIRIVCTTNAYFRWALILNPSRGVGTAANFQDLANTAIQVDITSTQILTGGFVIASGYGTTSFDAAELSTINNALTLASDYAGNSDELVLAVQNAGTTSSDNYFGSLDIIERL